MMTREAITEAAALLADLRLRENGRAAPLDDLPAAIRPETLDDAYRVQAALRAALSARGLGPSVGWKIGCTTPVMQAYLSIDHPCAGALYDASVHRDSARLAAADFFQLGLECEIAVRLGADLPARHGGHSADSVTHAVAAAMASIEIVEHRFRDFEKAATASLIADDFFSVGCVLGAEASLGELAALRGGFHVDGAPPESLGEGSAILGHPLNALAWLADHAAAQGVGLRAGEVVTLGSVVKTVYPRAGQRIEARFDGLAPTTVEIV